MKYLIATCMGRASAEFEDPSQRCSYREELMQMAGVHDAMQTAGIEQRADGHAVTNGHVVRIDTIYR